MEGCIFCSFVAFFYFVVAERRDCVRPGDIQMELRHFYVVRNMRRPQGTGHSQEPSLTHDKKKQIWSYKRFMRSYVSFCETNKKYLGNGLSDLGQGFIRLPPVDKTMQNLSRANRKKWVFALLKQITNETVIHFTSVFFSLADKRMLRGGAGRRGGP